METPVYTPLKHTECEDLIIDPQCFYFSEFREITPLVHNPLRWERQGGLCCGCYHWTKRTHLCDPKLTKFCPLITDDDCTPAFHAAYPEVAEREALKHKPDTIFLGRGIDCTTVQIEKKFVSTQLSCLISESQCVYTRDARKTPVTIYFSQPDDTNKPVLEKDTKPLWTDMRNGHTVCFNLKEGQVYFKRHSNSVITQTTVGIVPFYLDACVAAEQRNLFVVVIPEETRSMQPNV